MYTVADQEIYRGSESSPSWTFPPFFPLLYPSLPSSFPITSHLRLLPYVLFPPLFPLPLKRGFGDVTPEIFFHFYIVMCKFQYLFRGIKQVPILMSLATRKHT